MSSPSTSRTERYRLEKANGRPGLETIHTSWFYKPGRPPQASPGFLIGKRRFSGTKLSPLISRQSSLSWFVSQDILLEHTLTKQLASSVCPVYCRFCTRSYSVGIEIGTVSKTRFLPIQKKWEKMFEYIERTPLLHDVMIPGGDTSSLEPAQLDNIDHRLLSFHHSQRIRLASKGLAVCPSLILDGSDSWAKRVIQPLSPGRKIGKSVALHTRFNHPNEVTWITSSAAQKFFEIGVTVRNQTVFLKGVNSDLASMQQLIRDLAELNIQPVRQNAV